MSKKLQLFAALFLAANVFIINPVWANTSTTQTIDLSKQKQIMTKIERQNPQLKKAAMIAGVRAYNHLREQGKDSKQLLTIVDFTRPSTKKRLWVINMAQGRVDYFTYVAHGTKTGLNIAKHFSNRPNSHESSIGVYLTGNDYHGKVGYSMRINGLDKGFNNNAYQRNIVMHGDWMVSHRFAKKYGHIGRTWGCFGLNKKISPHIIAKIKNGTVMVAYYPDQRWLSHSIYEQPIQS